MRIKCKKSELLTGLNIVSKAVSTKAVKPILECILIEAKNGEVKLTANNLRLGIETYLGYDIKKFRDNIRFLEVIVNRDKLF